MTTAVLVGAIGAVIAAVLLAFTILIAWSKERNVVSRSSERSSAVIRSLIASDQAAALLEAERRGDVKNVEVLAKLLRSLDATENAIIQVGDTLIVKRSGTVSVFSLTSRQLRYLDRHSDLLKNPSDILDALANPAGPLASHPVAT